MDRGPRLKWWQVLGGAAVPPALLFWLRDDLSVAGALAAPWWAWAAVAAMLAPLVYQAVRYLRRP